MSRAFYIGRFNPPHFGHLEALKYITSQPNIRSIVIGIGSAQESFTLTNPLTAGERIEALFSMIIEAKFLAAENFFIIPIIDVNNNNLWVSHVCSLCPRFEVVFTNNSLVRSLFSQIGMPVETIPLFNRNEWSGTKIRNKIGRAEPWEGLLPRAVAKIIKAVKADERLQLLTKTDY